MFGVLKPYHPSHTSRMLCGADYQSRKRRKTAPNNSKTNTVSFTDCFGSWQTAKNVSHCWRRMCCSSALKDGRLLRSKPLSTFPSLPLHIASTFHRFTFNRAIRKTSAIPLHILIRITPTLSLLDQSFYHHLILLHRLMTTCQRYSPQTVLFRSLI